MMGLARSLLLAAALCLGAPPAAGKVIGTMTPAQPLSEERISALPEAQRAPWSAYWQRSQMRAVADKAVLAAERVGLARTPAMPLKGSAASVPLKRDPAWYSSAEARRIADNIVSFQTPAGGWDKNQDRGAPPRVRGQSWGSVGTIDNGATTTELRFLTRVQFALPGPDGAPYRAAFLRGLRYLLEAQYPNGGWPQYYPLQGDYHDAITFNDDALVKVAALLAAVGSGKEPYGFVSKALATEAQQATDRAVALILAAQVLVDGRRTGWGQQHDVLTLAPVGARNFEPASLSGNESASLLAFLMHLPRPSPAVVRAVHEGAAWLEARALSDVEWAGEGPEGRRLRPRPGAEPIWARYYDIATMRPIFGDRDRTIHDDVDEVSLERRNGYSWFGTSPGRVLSHYRSWAENHPL